MSVPRARLRADGATGVGSPATAATVDHPAGPGNPSSTSHSTKDATHLSEHDLRRARGIRPEKRICGTLAENGQHRDGERIERARERKEKRRKRRRWFPCPPAQIDHPSVRSRESLPFVYTLPSSPSALRVSTPQAPECPFLLGIPGFRFHHGVDGPVRGRIADRAIRVHVQHHFRWVPDVFRRRARRGRRADGNGPPG